MLEYFCEWIQKIAYYMIMVTLVMQVTAGEGYRKYIRLFTGIILILLILSPVVHLFGLEGEDFALSAEGEYEAAAERIEKKVQELEEEASAMLGAESFMEAGERGGMGLWDGNAGADEESGKAEEAGRIEVEEIQIGR